MDTRFIISAQEMGHNFFNEVLIVDTNEKLMN